MTFLRSRWIILSRWGARRPVRLSLRKGSSSGRFRMPIRTSTHKTHPSVLLKEIYPWRGKVVKLNFRLRLWARIGAGGGSGSGAEGGIQTGAAGFKHPRALWQEPGCQRWKPGAMVSGGGLKLRAIGEYPVVADEIAAGSGDECCQPPEE